MKAILTYTLFLIGTFAVGLTLVYSIDKEALHYEMKDSAYETYITKDK